MKPSNIISFSKCTKFFSNTLVSKMANPSATWITAVSQILANIHGQWDQNYEVTKQSENKTLTIVLRNFIPISCQATSHPWADRNYFIIWKRRTRAWQLFCAVGKKAWCPYMYLWFSLLGKWVSQELRITARLSTTGCQMIGCQRQVDAWRKVRRSPADVINRLSWPQHHQQEEFFTFFLTLCKFET